MAEEIIEETPPAEEAQVDENTEAEAPAEEPSAEEAAAEDENSKTLLSGDEGKEDGVPDEYKFDAPEGVEVNEEALAQFSEKAKDLGLTQSQYQGLIEYQTQLNAQGQEAMATQYEERVGQWAEATRTDPVIGGEDLDANLGLAKQAINTFGDDDLAKLIDAPSPDNPDGLGLGNHPAFIRLLYKVGTAVSESDLVTGDSKVEGPSSLERMYPSMFKAAG